MARSATLPLFGAGPSTSPGSDAPVEERGTPTSPPPPTWAGPLVRAAWPILSVLTRIVAGAGAENATLLHGLMIGQIQQFEQVALNAGISPREVSAARYTLCSAVDEAVLLSPWGRASDWNQGTLLSRFHGETWGGEKVFAIVERVLQAPEQHPDLIELLHIVMLLGFQGRFRVERDGTAKADAVRDRLFRVLRTRLREPQTLVPVASRTGPRAGTVSTPVPVWTVALVCLVLLLCLFGALRYSLEKQANAVAQTIYALIPAAGPAQPSGAVQATTVPAR